MLKCSNLTEFFHIHEIEPNNTKIYLQAITHSSFFSSSNKKNSYERLEFLGDSVIQFVVSSELFKMDDLNQGKMTELRAKVVRAETLASISIAIGLIDILKTAPGGSQETIKNSTKIQCDVFEAIVGAIYVDQGLDIAYNFVFKFIKQYINGARQVENKDPKSRLQEYFQNFSKENIKYNVNQLPNKIFQARAIHEGSVYGMGQGYSKKEAEIEAAIDALKKLK
ncbi:ribonuclease III [Mycoplasma crocodyli]|uniref:Ribonuclease 3 n=1 Tax=Mycoplasma crocodyli (strain ATCC 51981 / MP145) TaxID=512564 RepID=D5E4P5_MYCCM|nr:ribonuclease III [Mycoplasma crocodyli]ADE19637.1 ribonuclease III [Mycoplasma crocodyli MP145]